MNIDSLKHLSMDGKTVSPSGHDGLQAQKLADAATESWQTGRPVKVS